MHWHVVTMTCSCQAACFSFFWYSYRWNLYVQNCSGHGFSMATAFLFQGYIPFPRVFFSFPKGFYPFPRIHQGRQSFSMELALEVHAKEGQPVVAKATTGWSLLACNFQSWALPFPRLWGLTWQHMFPTALPSYSKPLPLSKNPFPRIFGYHQWFGQSVETCC